MACLREDFTLHGLISIKNKSGGGTKGQMEEGGHNKFRMGVGRYRVEPWDLGLIK